MDWLSIILLAVGLAMDCFAVSVTKGLASAKQAEWRRALLMAFYFGLYQGCMPLISFYVGSWFTGFITQWSHWIALVLLCFIGGKMIYESLTKDHEAELRQDSHVITHAQMHLLAIATSIDAMATGVLFVAQPERLWAAVAVIALTSTLFSILGYGLGQRFGRLLKFNVELLGGIILVGIGLKIFIEHYI